MVQNKKTAAAETIRLISQHQAVLLAYILTLHPDRIEAQDILQEANIVLWEKVDEFREGTNFKAWAFRIAYLQTLAHFKRCRRDQWLGFSSELVETLAHEAEPLLSDFEQRHQALRHCVAKLSSADHELLRSRYELGLPLAEIGGAMGRSVGALKQVLWRIRRSLRVCIQRQLVEEPAGA